MDTLLVGGDHYRDSRGLPVAVTGDEELIQRALIRLGVRRGAFPADPGLGSELHKLRESPGAPGLSLDRIARSYVQEALAPMTELAVQDVAVTRPEADCLLVAVTVSVRGTRYPLEVKVI